MSDKIIVKEEEVDSDIPFKTISRLHEFYLVGHLEEADKYINMFDRIRHAQADDIVKLYINCPGGDLMTALQFIRVLSETEATVVASVEGMCASAATLILLNADSYEITPHSLFLLHNYSEGTYGKGNEIFAHITHSRKWSQSLLGECYKDFLSPDEIENLLDDRDIWLTSDEVIERLKNRSTLSAARKAVPKE